MNPHQRAQLEAKLKSLPKSEQDRLFKRAAELRREDQKKSRGERKRYEDIDAPRPGSAKRKNDPVRMYVLKLLAGEETSRERERADGDEGLNKETRTGTAVHVGKRRCVVRPDESSGDEADDIACRLPASLAGRQQSELCVGDRVAFEDISGHPHIARVLPRDTVLSRRDPRTSERRAIVANVDLVVIVVSVVSPPLHPRLIDRYLLAIEDSWVERHGGKHADDPDPARPVIAVNKTDLLDGLGEDERAAELAKLEPYRALGIPTIECSAQVAHGIDALRAHLAGQTVAFVGHSGVGKSSLANALDARLGVRVGEIGSAANRGRHTTTASQLYEIRPEPSGPQHEPFWVIDTPGIRSFGLDELTPSELRDSMPELRELRRGCKFSDCTHTHEPSCAVLAGVESGEMPRARYETYLRLLDEIDAERTGRRAERRDAGPGEPLG